MAVVQRELVERRRWLTQEQFIEDWAVAQLMPGPNVINLSMVIGERHFGWRGALSALAGMLLAPLVVVLLLAALYGSVAHHPTAQGALRGMGAVAAGLVIGSGLKLLGALRHNPMGALACAALGTVTALAIAWLRWPMTTVLPAVGTVAVWWAWRGLPDTPSKP